MKRLMVCALVLILAAPAIARAQDDDQDRQNSSEYSDVENGQLLQLGSYLFTPFGMALEWGVMRPLNYLATKSSAAPLLSGDKGPSFFGENNNANQVPPGTFASTINPTNNLEAPTNSESSAPIASTGTIQAPAQTTSSPQPARSGGQPQLH
jgi:hypothetical protein